MSFLDLLRNPKKFKRVICKVSGTSFYDLAEVVTKLKEGMVVSLDQDPENEHDRMALRVMVDVGDGPKQLGFVPRPVNQNVCALLLSGAEMESKIIGITPPRGGYSYYGVKIEIRVADE